MLSRVQGMLTPIIYRGMSQQNIASVANEMAGKGMAFLLRDPDILRELDSSVGRELSLYPLLIPHKYSLSVRDGLYSLFSHRR